MLKDTVLVVDEFLDAALRGRLSVTASTPGDLLACHAHVAGGETVVIATRVRQCAPSGSYCSR